ncbi:DUF4192 domain-containing protein [Nocardia sp. NPDC049149]|uniref:DUF4192 domain-containing protein n=1 Tax=Nocardia sp. NPDC049149 TaxID=3364315 RepID=UPI003712E3C4
MSSSPIHIDDPGDFIAAIPVMLGFVPERSLIVTALKESACDPPTGSASVFAALRFDLDQPEGLLGGPAELLAAAVIRICASADSTEVMAVVVDDRVPVPVSGQGGGGRGANAALIDSLAEHLADSGIGLVAAWTTPAIAPRQLWWSMLGPDNEGLIPDVKASAVSMDMIAGGKPVLASRSDLAALVEPDQETVERVDRLLPSARATVLRRYAASRRDGDPDGGTRGSFKRVLGLIAAVDSGRLPTVPQTAELAAILADRRVRDGLLATALSNYARAAESLWLHLTRTLPSPERAEAAVLLAYSAYIRRHGTLAGIAMQAALDADPYHHLAIMLEAALELGLEPESMRQLGRSGAKITRRLGIETDLPPDASS